MLARLLLASPLRDQLKGIAVGDGCICGSTNGVACVAPRQQMAVGGFGRG